MLPPIAPLLETLTSTSKVLVIGNSTASVQPNGARAFDFFDDSVSNINSNVTLFQQTEIKF